MRWAAWLPAFFVAAACGSSDDGPTGTLVVGVEGPTLGGVVSGYRVVVKQNGAIVQDETVPSIEAGDAVTVTGPVGALVEAEVDALPAAGGAPLITRLASSRIVAGGTKLMRMRLETSCVVVNGVGPTCAAPTTCIGGACASSSVAADALEDFTADWASVPPPDACRPAKPGAPALELGTGQTDYAPLTEGETVTMEQGPQGGHHIWIAVRMKNLRQEGSTTTLTATLAGNAGLTVAPFSVVFAFDPDEGGYCKEYGLRFQLDASTLGSDGVPQTGPDYHVFLGQTLNVTATVKDTTGASATDAKTLQIAPKILCADGTDACNTSP